jgi:alanyl-tRNA synthetase
MIALASIIIIKYIKHKLDFIGVNCPTVVIFPLNFAFIRQKSYNKSMTSYSLLKNKFFEFFTCKGYQHLPSSHLILDDPHLLFTVAGMVQFKDIFLRNIPKTHDRVITVQKCLRVGGKHNDLDNVGFTKRHNTFFEMMGHFAFYDDGYSKFNIIKDAVDFLVSVGLSMEKMWVTIDHQDDECYEIWSQIIDKNKIIREPSGENFWSMGEEGPCGFCTEILYDRQYNHDYDEINHGDVLKDGERFLEVWNIVFMTKIRTQGVIKDTPGLSIDTGMGLERLLSIIENVDTNFETSVFTPIINAMKVFIPHGPDYIYKICADHLRSAVFLLAEGLRPSGEKQGYILKKIIRRAIFYYKDYYNQPLLWQLVPVVQSLMGDFYPEILQENIPIILKEEEEKILHHLQQSEEIIKKNIQESPLNANGTMGLDGDKMFFLYDTWGVNLSALEDYAQVHNIQLDYEGFQKAMDKQKIQSGQKIIIEDDLDATMFVGYDNYGNHHDYQAQIVGVYNLKGQPLDEPASTAIIVTDKTWFFPESCGQVGDTGEININGASFKVINTLYYGSHGAKVIGHWVENPTLATIGLTPCKLQVNYPRRLNIARHHTGTHLLNKAFNQVMGPGDQKGSWVGENKFRWDVACDKTITPEDVKTMEQLVNEKIQEAIPLQIQDLLLEQATQEGYYFLKNTFYEPQVRCISINEWSKELCHGTHVANTAELKNFKILKKKSISAGVVRFECVTGDYMEEKNVQEDLGVNKTLEPLLVVDHKGWAIVVLDKIDLVWYDKYKYAYDWVILLGTNHGILMGTEKYRDLLAPQVNQLKSLFDVKGTGDHRLFRGKIMDSMAWENIVEQLKSLIK